MEQKTALNMSSVSNEFVNFQHEKKRNDFFSFRLKICQTLLHACYFFLNFLSLTTAIRSVIHNDGAHENLFRLLFLVMLLFLFSMRAFISDVYL